MKVPWTEDDEATRIRREIDELRARLEYLEARVDTRVDRLEDDHRGRIDRLEDDHRGRIERLEALPTAGDRQRRTTKPVDMHDLEDWVVTWLSDTLERRVSNTRRWCPQWYDHPEVLHRMWLLFQSYRETMLYDDAKDQSQWFLEHLDKHLDAMLSADGPFAGCSPQRHSPARGLEVRRAPEGTWGPRLEDLRKAAGGSQKRLPAPQPEPAPARR
jgi:hypothetical protein